MSTRANVNFVNDNNEIVGNVYVHHDGYLSNLGKSVLDFSKKFTNLKNKNSIELAKLFIEHHEEYNKGSYKKDSFEIGNNGDIEYLYRINVNTMNSTVSYGDFGSEKLEKMKFSDLENLLSLD